MTPTRAPSPFDPCRGGTPEAVWRQAMNHAPVWIPGNGPVLVISPHPDDEVLGVGGLIGMLSRRGTDVTVVSVTDGERAYAGIPGLAAIRRRELDRALLTLAPRARRHHLGLPDGGVAQHEHALASTLRRLVTRDTTVIAPYEFDGHADHEAAGRAALQLGLPLIRYPIWFWHRCTPARAAGLRVRRFPLPAFMQRAKALALRAFRSQLAPPGREPILPPAVLSYFSRPYETLVLPP